MQKTTVGLFVPGPGAACCHAKLLQMLFKEAKKHLDPLWLNIAIQFPADYFRSGCSGRDVRTAQWKSEISLYSKYAVKHEGQNRKIAR